MTGKETVVRVRKVVDTTYLGTEIPARHEPGFEVEPGARVVTPNELVELADAPRGSPSSVPADRNGRLHLAALSVGRSGAHPVGATA